jgi:hypothetical protein
MEDRKSSSGCRSRERSGRATARSIDRCAATGLILTMRCIDRPRGERKLLTAREAAIVPWLMQDRKTREKTSMKAVLLTGHDGPEMLQYGDAPDPMPAPDEIVIDVHAASVNAADYKVRFPTRGSASSPSDRATRSLLASCRQPTRCSSRNSSAPRSTRKRAELLKVLPH